MQTKMDVDGVDTGVRLRLDLNSVFQAVVIAAIIGFGTWLFQIKDAVRDAKDQMSAQMGELKSEVRLTNYKLEQMEKNTSNFITIKEVQQMRQMRDMQLSGLESKIDVLGGRITTLETKAGHAFAPPGGLKVER